MSRTKKGEGRGLESFEVALIKAMSFKGMARDEVMSYFVRPGRVISPAAISEIASGKIGPDILPVSQHELDQYIEKRLNEPPPTADQELQTAWSPVELRRTLSDWLRPQLQFENNTIEVKREVPKDKVGYAKTVKSIAAFANSEGGYLFFGISDSHNLVGLSASVDEQVAWRAIGDKVKELLSPAVIWERVHFEMNSTLLGAIYVQKSLDKPIICMSDYTTEIAAGDIFFRYSGQSAKIRPGDFLNLLAQRDLALAKGMRT